MIETEIEFQYKGNSKFKQFVNKKVYEKFLLNLLNQLEQYNNLVSIEEQSHSEGDFIDKNTGVSYEATLLVNEGIISNVLNGKEYLYSEELIKKRTDDILSVFVDSLKRKQKKEMDIIFFNIFPEVFTKFQGSITEQYFYDETDLIINKILNEKLDLVANKRLILVSYNDDDSFFCRTLHQRQNDLLFIHKYDATIFPFKIITRRINYQNELTRT